MLKLKKDIDLLIVEVKENRAKLIKAKKDKKTIKSLRNKSKEEDKMFKLNNSCSSEDQNPSKVQKNSFYSGMKYLLDDEANIA